MTTAINDNIQGLNPDGSIDTDFYYNASIDIINRGIIQDGRDPQRITTNQLLYYLQLCYESLYKQHEPIKNNPKNRLPYNEAVISSLLDIYIKICRHFDALPSLYSAAVYTGIDDEVLNKYVTAAGSIIGKARKSYIQNRLNNSPLGVLTLANNDIDTGLLYTRQNIVDHATVKKALSFTDLQRIAEKTTAEDVQM